MINSAIALVSKMSGISGIEVDKRSDIFSFAVFVNSVSIMGGIQHEILDMEFWKIAVEIGSHVHVEVVTEEIRFPVGIPSPVTVRLGIMTLAVTGRTAFFLTIADPFFSLLCGSTDRSAIAGKSQM